MPPASPARGHRRVEVISTPLSFHCRPIGVYGRQPRTRSRQLGKRVNDNASQSRSGRRCRVRWQAYGRVMASTNGGDPSDRIAQAQGMVAVQADCSLDEALLLMRARARSNDLSLAYVACAVLDGHIRFCD